MTVDRRVLIEALRKRGIKGSLVRRTEEMVRETKSRVRIGEETGENFWMVRGMRQGCPLSPLLLSILTADLKEMKKVKWEGVRLGERKIYLLAYVDDIVLIAEAKDQLRSMMERLERYLDEKNLELNTRKSKIKRFKRGGERESKRRRCKEKVITWRR